MWIQDKQQFTALSSSFSSGCQTALGEILSTIHSLSLLAHTSAFQSSGRTHSHCPLEEALPLNSHAGKGGSAYRDVASDMHDPAQHVSPCQSSEPGPPQWDRDSSVVGVALQRIFKFIQTSDFFFYKRLRCPFFLPFQISERIFKQIFK